MLQFGHSSYSIGNKALQRLHFTVDSFWRIFPFEHFGVLSMKTCDINCIGEIFT